MKKKVSFIIFLLLATPFSARANQGIVNPQQVYTYEIMKKDLNELQNRYEPLLNIIKIGKSHFGRKIYAVKLGDGEQNILLIGAHHGREWLTTALLMKMMEEYAEEYQKQEKCGPYSMDVLNDISIWFVPMLNPDGVEISQGNTDEFSFLYRGRIYHLNKHNRNLRRWKANGKGIDLNRQYPSGWKELPNTPQAPSYQFYKGRRPLEARETRSIMKFTTDINPLISVAYHSSGREIYWKYQNGKHMKRDEEIAKKAAFLTGYKLSLPPEIAYGGGYTDWFISTFHRPALTIEICPLVEDTSPPLSTFNEEWNRNKYMGIMLAEEMKKWCDALPHS